MAPNLILWYSQLPHNWGSFFKQGTA